MKAPVQLLLLLAFGTIMPPTRILAQTACQKVARHTPAFFYCKYIDKVSSAQAKDKLAASADLAKFFSIDEGMLPAALGYSQLDAMFQHAQDSRVDKQTGADGSASGTSSLVSLPGATDLLSVAVSSGALTQSSSGTTTTFGANVGQLVATVARTETFDYTLKGIPVLQNIDATLSIGTKPGTATVPITTDSSGNETGAATTTPSSTHTVTGATARYQFFNRFDPHSAEFKNNFQIAMQNRDNGADVDDAFGAAASKLIGHYRPLVADPSALKQQATLFAAAQDEDTLITLFNTYFNLVQSKLKNDPTFEADLATFVNAMDAHLNLYREVVSKSKGVPAITAEYTFANNPNQPQTHNGRLIVALQSTDGKMFTANVAATFYGTLPTGANINHFRDFQAAAQIDLPVAPNATKNGIDFSAAAYGQYQQSASLLDVPVSDLPSGFPAASAPFVAGTQGWLGVAQAKLTIHGPNGIQIVPLSWKWASRTDLFTQADSSFQFGLSYDLSSVGQLFGLPH